jgi:hypothetical protein
MADESMNNGPIVWDEDLYGSVATEVPAMMDRTNEMVGSFLELNKTWAQTSLDTAMTTLQELSAAQFSGALPPPPDPPGLTTTADVSTDLGGPVVPNLGHIDTSDPNPLVLDPVKVPDVGGDVDEVPEYTRVVNGVTIPEAPIFAFPATPPAPGIDTSFTFPTEPTPKYGEPPVLWEFTVPPPYTMPVLPMFDDEVPEFDTPPPNPVIDWTEPVYLSNVKDAIEAVILEMLEGGTGIPPSVEQAIWDRARQREDNSAEQTISAAVDQWATRGFSHPFGMLNKQSIVVRDAALLKNNSLSRDVAIKQAELEQSNRQFAVTHGLTYEQIYVGIFLAVVDRNFQIAKFEVETAIQLYNMQIMIFNIQQQIFTQKGERFRLQLEAALAPLKMYQMLVEVEKAKAEVNQAMVASYTAEIQAYATEVQAYKTSVEAQVAKSSMEKLKIDLYKAQIDAMVAQVAAQRGAFDAYTARVGGETAKVQLEQANASVYNTQVQAWSTLVGANLKKAEVDIANNRMLLEVHIAEMQRIQTLNAQQLTLVQANLAGWQASLQYQTALANLETTVKQAGIQKEIELSRLQVSKFSAMLEEWKAHATHILEQARITSESLRAAGQMAATLTAGAMAGTHVSAGVSSGVSAQQQRADHKSESKGFTQSQGSTYSTTHSYPHKTQP